MQPLLSNLCCYHSSRQQQIPRLQSPSNWPEIFASVIPLSFSSLCSFNWCMIDASLRSRRDQPCQSTCPSALRYWIPVEPTRSKWSLLTNFLLWISQSRTAISICDLVQRNPWFIALVACSRKFITKNYSNDAEMLFSGKFLNSQETLCVAEISLLFRHLSPAVRSALPSECPHGFYHED